jgi:deoxyribonuclease-1
MKTLITLLITILITTPTFAANQEIKSFSKAKSILEKQVYDNHRRTLYCGATFNASRQITPPKGFTATKYVKRAKKLEWEHVVPAENFGRNFSEWRDGHKRCITKKGEVYTGRRCAEKVNLEYRYMQSDMFNLYPAIGAVNALRVNYNFTMLPAEKSDFGSCAMKIDNRKAEPPEMARGRIARTYLYMEGAYKRYKMSKSQKKLMNAWDHMYPVNAWECARAKKITRLQNSDNVVVKNRCDALNMW